MIQVFEGTENMSLTNTHTKLTGHPMEVALSPDMLGRTFNGIGEPIDDLGPITSTLRRNINGLPLNPVKREYPRNYIRTGISAIDGLTTPVSYTHLSISIRRTKHCMNVMLCRKGLSGSMQMTGSEVFSALSDIRKTIKRICCLYVISHRWQDQITAWEYQEENS